MVRSSFSRRGNEGKHHHVGVGIEEDILDELLGAAEAGLSKTVLADEVSLHVEYELPAAEAIERRVRIDRRDLVQLTEAAGPPGSGVRRSEEHTSELQSLMRISYAVF